MINIELMNFRSKRYTLPGTRSGSTGQLYTPDLETESSHSDNGALSECFEYDHNRTKSSQRIPLPYPQTNRSDPPGSAYILH